MQAWSEPNKAAAAKECRSAVGDNNVVLNTARSTVLPTAKCGRGVDRSSVLSAGELPRPDSLRQHVREVTVI